MVGFGDRTPTEPETSELSNEIHPDRYPICEKCVVSSVMLEICLNLIIPVKIKIKFFGRKSLYSSVAEGGQLIFTA